MSFIIPYVDSYFCLSLLQMSPGLDLLVSLCSMEFPSPELPSGNRKAEDLRGSDDNVNISSDQLLDAPGGQVSGLDNLDVNICTTGKSEEGYDAGRGEIISDSSSGAANKQDATEYKEPYELLDEDSPAVHQQVIKVKVY